MKLQGKIQEMIPIQREIIHASILHGGTERIVNAWNYLSILLGKVCDYPVAEDAARNALEVYSREEHPKLENLGSYHMVLSRILAAQKRFAEGVAEADRAVACFAIFHNPSDEFLAARIEEAERMRQLRDRGEENEVSSPKPHNDRSGPRA
ncbi:hypothetical protein [Luteolibacter soli]|uniref:Tetratricopeptide repeat protein n=1 Tax=Luteolibacter soli TaxID=3135280 RepID=A0ABU9AR55_9BACT